MNIHKIATFSTRCHQLNRKLASLRALLNFAMRHTICLVANSCGALGLTRIVALATADETVSEDPQIKLVRE